MAINSTDTFDAEKLGLLVLQGAGIFGLLIPDGLHPEAELMGGREMRRKCGCVAARRGVARM